MARRSAKEGEFTVSSEGVSKVPAVLFGDAQPPDLPAGGTIWHGLKLGLAPLTLRSQSSRQNEGFGPFAEASDGEQGE